ncbi:MAG: TetR/AcrR family transcriptional regulator C-terminal domain-containing protein [Lactobacillus sp.]|jgi:probable dihydroxyacetone kinase regulator|nr:TetR/AcrR family transcriptional regulator C-terminal domain-containing protein [Lactobacillus sp.]MCI2031988.1 TetR/AcrR family transcriptional regulator C-terminal domain-containing protein [Lactobacillus sp.]
MDTKTKIADATKRLVISQPFTAINVTTIMREAGLRRQTFYDYFRDKYDVLGAIYASEVAAAAHYCGHYRYWPQTVASIVAYFAANRAFYQRVLQIDEQNAPEQVIRQHLQTMVADIFTTMGQAETVVIDTAYCGFVKTLLGDALLAGLKSWLLAPTPVSAAQETTYLQAYFQDEINGFLLRARKLAVVNGH